MRLLIDFICLRYSDVIFLIFFRNTFKCATVSRWGDRLPILIDSVVDEK